MLDAETDVDSKIKEDLAIMETLQVSLKESISKMNVSAHKIYLDEAVRK